MTQSKILFTILLYLSAASIPITQVNAKKFSEHNEKYTEVQLHYRLDRSIELCDWRLLELTTEADEPKKLLPIALFKQYGSFKNLFIQKSTSPSKMEHKQHALFYSNWPFSQARLNTELNAKTFVYALCEFKLPEREQKKTLRVNDSDSVGQESKSSSFEVVPFLSSSHPFDIYLNGRLLKAASPHIETSFSINLTALYDKIKTDYQRSPKQQILLRFYPHLSNIYWGLSATPNVLHNLRSQLKTQELSAQAISDQVESHVHLFPHHNQKLKSTAQIDHIDFNKLEQIIEESQTSEKHTILSNKNKTSAHWKTQAWSISVMKPTPTKMLNGSTYRIRSLQRFFLPFSMLSDDQERITQKRLKTHLLNVKNYFKHNISLRPEKSSHALKSELIGCKDFYQNLDYEMDKNGVYFTIKQSFQWTRPLWSLVWHLSSVDGFKANQTPTQNTIILIDKTLDSLGQWAKNNFKRSVSSSQDITWISRSKTSVTNLSNQTPALFWSKFTEDSSLVRMYKPIRKALFHLNSLAIEHSDHPPNSSSLNKKKASSKGSAIEALSDWDRYARTRSEFDTLATYYEERPSGLKWTKEAIPSKKQLFFEWVLWLKKQLQVRFVDYPSPILTNHPLSAEYKLTQLINKKNNNMSGKASEKLILWSPESIEQKLLNTTPLHYWGVKLKAQKDALKLEPIKALNNFNVPHGSYYLSLTQFSTQSSAQSLAKRQQVAWPSIKLNLNIQIDKDLNNSDLLWTTWKLEPWLTIQEFAQLFHLPSIMDRSKQSINNLYEHWFPPSLADQILNQLNISPQFQYVQSTWWPSTTWPLVKTISNPTEQSQQVTKEWRAAFKGAADKLRVNHSEQTLTITQRITADSSVILPIYLDHFRTNSAPKLQSLLINRTIRLSDSLFSILCTPRVSSNDKLDSDLKIKSGQGLYYHHQTLPNTSANEVKYTELQTQLQLRLNSPFMSLVNLATDWRINSPKQSHLSAQFMMLKELEENLCEPSLRHGRIGHTQAQR